MFARKRDRTRLHGNLARKHDCPWIFCDAISKLGLTATFDYLHPRGSPKTGHERSLQKRPR
jgi:hypothetical protein